jgi:hypothetical protein
MKAGGYCAITCERGYWASGFLACDETSMEWNLPSCNLHNYTFQRQVYYEFQLTGVQADTVAERQVVTESLLRALAGKFGLSKHLMHLELTPHAPSLPPIENGGFEHLMEAAAPPSTAFKADLRIACEKCEFVLRRLYLVGQHARDFDAALAQAICGDRCLALPDNQMQRKTCFQNCPESQNPLQTLYRRDPIIEQMPL